jgi:hypothetical protein
VTLGGGTAFPGYLLNIQDKAGSTTYNNMLGLTRQNKTASLAFRAGGVPRLNFALQQNYDANAFGNYGVLNMVGEWDFGEPVVAIQRTGLKAILLSSIPVSTDTVAPRFSMLADGTINWSQGTAAVDANLYRSAAKTLRTDGNLVVGGNLSVTGTKAALVSTTAYGPRELYAVESPQNWFEDFGSAKMMGGEKVVEIEPIFRSTVDTDRGYHVFLTPNGRCSLYVAEKWRSSFQVKSLAGAADCSFDYRIVASRKGFEKVRLATAAK